MGDAGSTSHVGNQQNIQHQKVTKKSILDAYSHRFNSFLWKYLSRFRFYESVITEMALDVCEGVIQGWYI